MTSLLRIFGRHPPPAPNQLAMASVIRSRAIAGMQKPPLKRTASGLAICRRSSMCDREFSPAPIAIAACLRNAARCFVMAGSVAYGSPISRRPAARVRRGISSEVVNGRKPPLINSATSSRRNSPLTIWPTTDRPPPRMLMGRQSVFSSLSRRSLAAEHMIRNA